MAGISFKKAWSLLKEQRKADNRWKGVATLADIMAVLRALDVGFSRVIVEPRKYTLNRWAVLNAQRGTRYLIITTNHAQVLQDGIVLDQNGIVQLENYFGRRKRVICGIALEAA